MSEHSTRGQMSKKDLPQAFGHPRGLIYLFFAELWERFSFYGMRALLTLYMVNELFKDLQDGETRGLGIYAAYGALVYATPLIGGLIADRLIGFRKSIMLGAALMTLGHFIMAFESEFWFFTALGLLIIGNGFFKPNISSLVGELYEEGDLRRDAGFTIFYMSINLGAALSPLVCGWLGATYGWHYGFGAAGVGMFIGLLFFWQGSNSGVFGDNGLQPEEYQEKKYAGMNIYLPIILLSFILVPIASYMVYNNEAIMGNALNIVGLLVLVYLIYILVSLKDSVARQRILVIVFITLLLTVFWSFFEQAGSSLTLFAQRNVNLKFLNAAQTNSINPGYIIFLALPFAFMWTFLSKRKSNPRTPFKYALGILQLGLGFLIFAWSANYMDGAGRVPMMFLMLGWLVITTGELFVSPIGLSKVTELSPKHMVAFFMGVFFLSSSFAHHIAGIIAQMTVPAESTSEVYEPRDDMFTNFASWATGIDQNKVGEFDFNIQNSHKKLVNTENAGYPSLADFDGYVSNIGAMGAINPMWKSAGNTISEHAGKIKPLLIKLTGYAASDSLGLTDLYKKYNAAHQEMLGQNSIGSAYEMLKDPTKMKTEDFDKIGEEWRTKAAELIQIESSMESKNPEWAKTAMSFNNGIEENRQQIRPLVGLTTYTKIFAQIALISFIVAGITFLISPVIIKWMNGIN